MHASYYSYSCSSLVHASAESKARQCEYESLVSDTYLCACSCRNRRQTTKRPKPSPEEIKKWRENAAALIPETFTSAIMCIGSEIGGIGACKGDNGGPGFIFDTGDGIVSEKYVQVSTLEE